ncbi:MAG: hypothetical protein COA39_000090 [Sulfurimonas sp.]|nr:hypothetical protein [Sulfurimonas sp.]
MNRIEIKVLFKGLEGINEAKRVYKELAKKLHPDVGGSDEEFKVLNKVYNDFIENGLIIDDESEIDLELEKIVSQILHYENIIIEVVGSWIWVSGDTKAVKDILKGLGFKWAKKKVMWYYGEMKGRSPEQKSMADIKNKYGSERVYSKSQQKITV